MKKALVFFLLILMVGGLFVSPTGISTDNEGQRIVSDFIPSADGDLASDSVTSFSETLTDDVLFYPDTFSNSTIDLADTGDAQGAVVAGDYTYTHVSDNDEYDAFDNGVPNPAWIELNFSLSSYTGYGEIDAIELNIKYAVFGGEAGDGLQAYDFIDVAWDDLNTATYGSAHWENTTLYDAGYWDSAVLLIRVMSDEPATCWAQVDYAEILVSFMTLADSDHYAESFTDVSEWTVSIGNAISSDGDTISLQPDADAGYDKIYTNVPSFSNDLGLYYEYNVKTNESSSTFIQVYGYESDGASTTAHSFDSYLVTTSWVTRKGIITHDGPLESISILFKSSVASKIEVDYLRISAATETGWQHDGSTTQGVSDDGDAGVTYTVSSDSDILTMNATKGAGIAGGYVEFHIAIDTTTTSIDIEDDYYPFFATYFKVESDSSNVKVIPIWDGRYSSSTVTRSSWQTLRVNHKASTGSSSSKYLRFDAYLSELQSVEWSVDWAKAYSIANFTVQSMYCTTTDFFYVSSGIVYASMTSSFTATYQGLRLDSDIAKAVDVSTYTGWNMTTTDFTSVLWNKYIAGSWDGYSTATDTRGTYTASSGSLTDFEVLFWSTSNLIAIKFYIDSADPVIGNVWATPYTPTDDDSVSVSVYVTDSTGFDLYNVTINAIDYPSGFSDVDYICTKNTENTALWNYTFTTMTAGYYAFEVTADDGVRTAVEVVIFRVVPVVLQITDIVLITATEDLVQISGHTNKDCSYQIYENDTLEGTGSASYGWFSISWTKDTTAGAYVELGVRFNTTLYDDWINGSYSVASATILQISDTDLSTTETQVEASGYVNLACDYQIYENDTLIDSGSLTAGDYSITWVKATTIGLIDVGVRFNDTTTERWDNGSYYVSATYDRCQVTVYNSRGNFESDNYILYINGTRQSDWEFYNRTDYVFNITITDYFGDSVYEANHTFSRFVDIELTFYTFKVLSEKQGEAIYFNLTSSSGATYSQHIMTGEILTYYLITGTYTYEFTTTDNQETLYSGNFILSGDTTFIIDDFNLQDIFEQFGLVGGGGSDDDVVETVILAQLQLGIIGLFVFMAILQVPSVNNFVTSGSKAKGKNPYPTQLQGFEFGSGKVKERRTTIPRKDRERERR